jgi:hypothetical protein
MELVKGYPCRNCADVELAKKGINPARPHREWSGGEVYVRGPDPETDPRAIRLGKAETRPELSNGASVYSPAGASGSTVRGARLSLTA